MTNEELEKFIELTKENIASNDRVLKAMGDMTKHRRLDFWWQMAFLVSWLTAAIVILVSK